MTRQSLDIRGVIFDLDGTLLDTLEDLADSANAALASFGYPVHPLEAYRYFVGEGLTRLVERILPPENCSIPQVQACMQQFEQIYRTNWDAKSHPYSGIDAMLQELRRQELRLAVLSNKPDAFTRICVQRWFPDGLFDFVCGQREGVPRKPDPAGALELAERMGLKPCHILYVGDTATDMQTGTSAGMTTTGVLWGFRTRQELEENGAAMIVAHPQEIVEYVTGL